MPCCVITALLVTSRGFKAKYDLICDQSHLDSRRRRASGLKDDFYRGLLGSDGPSVTEAFA